MSIVGGLFQGETDLLVALETLQEHGFDTMTVYGPDELFREPDANERWSELQQGQQHTAGGTISGITVNPRPLGIENPSARTVTDDLVSIGVSEENADAFVDGLDEGQRLLLVVTKTGRADEVKQLIREQGGTIPGRQ